MSEPRIDAVEPVVVRPPLHQYFTRDWRFWGAISACLLIIGTVMALLVTLRSNDQLHDQILGNDENSQCRAELASEVGLANAKLQVTLAEQSVALTNAFIAVVQGNEQAQASYIETLDLLADELSADAVALEEAVANQEERLASCG
jgi:hypothetical protein